MHAFAAAQARGMFLIPVVWGVLNEETRFLPNELK